MLIKRKPEISEEEFHKYWTEEHPAIVNEWLAKHGVVKYVQYHLPSSFRAQSEQVWTELGSDHVSDFDGHVVLTVPNLDALKNALADPYYKSHVQPDEAKFIDAKGCYRTFGYEQIYIKDNKVISDGVSTSKL
ncbi:hypothetical protein PFICI_12747 [Pestalotiopsis fici W106-1]|uniref:EthD domain-containing protein n=1 Tax=Pestalotiopsis fici (strain W106-1 / CGMCC3.15140) TaxID=1229662 RepID=W3WPM0_PESFW|nr:uncharacterized protein PFICI_12747 [Pestalotiopsis fici W106-1]ETS75803.1 hypothetical protein PFICI_12747 [Pestalotiopsis fici W106-1]